MKTLTDTVWIDILLPLRLLNKFLESSAERLLRYFRLCTFVTAGAHTIAAACNSYAGGKEYRLLRYVPAIVPAADEKVFMEAQEQMMRQELELKNQGKEPKHHDYKRKHENPKATIHAEAALICLFYKYAQSNGMTLDGADESTRDSFHEIFGSGVSSFATSCKPSLNYLTVAHHCAPNCSDEKVLLDVQPICSDNEGRLEFYKRK